MRVLVGCERSGVVREAFRALGHDAWSCDLVPADDGSPYHIQDDVLAHLGDGWDLGIFHPPCTHLCVSGARHFKRKREKVERAVEFVQALMNCAIPRWCIENPVGILSTRIRRPDQIIHPWQFGHPDEKTTCLWMRRLPGLFPTKIVEVEYVTTQSGKTWSRWFLETSSLPLEIRSKVRSETFSGIAKAMAAQWGWL